MYLKVDYVYKVLDTRKEKDQIHIIRMLTANDNISNPHEVAGVIFVGKRKGEPYWFGKHEVLEEFCPYEEFQDKHQEYYI